MTASERIAGAVALLIRFQGKPYQDAAVAYLRAQIEQVQKADDRKPIGAEP